MSLPELRLHLYTVGPILLILPLYLETGLSQARSAFRWGGQTDLISQTIPNVSSLVHGNDASSMVRVPSRIQAQLAASSDVRVFRICLHCLWGFSTVSCSECLFHSPLPSQIAPGL